MEIDIQNKKKSRIESFPSRDAGLIIFRRSSSNKLIMAKFLWTNTPRPSDKLRNTLR